MHLLECYGVTTVFGIELATAVEEQLSIPIVIWHNHSYAMIRDSMIKRGISQIGVNPGTPDFVKLAEAIGCPGVEVASEAGFRQTLSDTLAQPDRRQ